MESRTLLRILPLATLALLACASAGKRYEQGLEYETRGQYEHATTRYTQALQKDPNHGEARSHLQNAGELAIQQRLEDAVYWNSRNEPVTAADQYHGADAVWAQARSVGVRLEMPADYDLQRRNAFDDAIEALQQSGDEARAQGRWSDGLDSYRRARNDFEPNGEQRTQLYTGEAGLLVDWSASEYAGGHLRAAYDVAAAVHHLEWSPIDESEQATALMEQALHEGEVQLLVLPIQSATRSRNPHRNDAQANLLGEIDATLQQGHWRQAPAFVAVKDPLIVRDLLTHTGLLHGEFRAPAMATVLRLAEADYGALLQLTRVDETEFDVRSTTRVATTRDGKSATFTQKEGKRKLAAEARVFVIDDYGNIVCDLSVTGTGVAPFSRGEYSGDPSDLNLDSRQVHLFDRFAQEDQLRAVQRALASDLAQAMAGTVYGQVLALVP